jgi:DNA packaging protein, QLRG family|nr:MAG TPA: head tail connector [Caudoviricetes sp.]
MVDNKILQEVKEYIRVDDYGDDSNNKTNEEIKMFIMSAETFLKSHGVKKDYNNELYKIAIFMLVSIWYDNRGLAEQGAREIPFGVTRIIRQLNMLNDYGTV